MEYGWCSNADQKNSVLFFFGDRDNNKKKTFFASKTCPSKIHVYSRSTNVCPNNACQIFNVADFQLGGICSKAPLS